MASERESRQQSIWEHREPEGGPGQPAPTPPEAPCEPRLQAVNRQQMAWRAVDVEQLIAEDHPARAIWQLVGKLDLSSFYKGISAVEGEAGRPALDPQLLISLWIYGYSEGVSSAREIARLCEFDPAYQWLTGLQPVNYHSLSDFRVGHREALDKLFMEVLGLLSAEGLVSLQRVMHDGTKVKACAGADTFRREEKIRAHLEIARQQVREMGDPQNEELSQRVAKARQRAARERQERLERAEKELQELRARKSTAEAQREARVSETDPEARIMKQAGGGYAPAYNVQISTDAAQGILPSQNGHRRGETNLSATRRGGGISKCLDQNQDRPATISIARLSQSDHGDTVGLSDLQHSTVDSSPLAGAISAKNGVRTGTLKRGKMQHTK